MNKFFNPNCTKCAHYKGGKCLLTNFSPKENTFCLYYTESPYICEICGNHLLAEQVILESGNATSYHLVCAKCSSTIGLCNSCKQTNICRFQTDNTISEPLYVVQEIRQGPMVTQQQVKNPNRMKQTCINCSCYKSGKCLKEDNNFCEHYQCIVKNW